MWPTSHQRRIRDTTRALPQNRNNKFLINCLARSSPMQRFYLMPSKQRPTFVSSPHDVGSRGWHPTKADITIKEELVTAKPFGSLPLAPYKRLNCVSAAQRIRVTYLEGLPRANLSILLFSQHPPTSTHPERPFIIVIVGPRDRINMRHIFGDFVWPAGIIGKENGRIEEKNVY